MLSTAGSLLRTLVAALLVSGLLAACGTSSDGLDGRSDDELPVSTEGYRGANWADPRDNFASDELVLSELDRGMEYDEAHAVADRVLGGFQDDLAATTVRLPINPATVTTDWWDTYRATIDAARERDMEVVLAYWESEEAKDGFIDDDEAFEQMWDTVVEDYAQDEGVLFEVMNEPYGYGLEDWIELVASWIERYEDQIPRSRVVVSGTGYNDDVTGVGTAEELEGTLLSLHYYGYWDSHTDADVWEADLRSRLGEYGARTLFTEAGSPMTTGLNYGNPEGDVSTSYLAALTRVARDFGMGILYWPGLRMDDSYSLLRATEDGSLEITNESGVERMRWGWGLIDEEPINDDAPAPPGEPLQLEDTGDCLDVSSGSSEPGAEVGLWECNGGQNQSWDVREDGAVTVYGAMCLTADAGGQDGAVTIEDCDGTQAQAWQRGSDGALRPASDGTLVLGRAASDGSLRIMDEGDADAWRWKTGL